MITKDPQRELKKKAMFVGAHPDDIDYFAGGLLRNLASAGWKIRSVILTSGEKGTRDLKMRPNDLVRIREKEQKKSMLLLGCKDVVFARFKCRDLASDFMKARKFLTEEVRKFKPQMLVSFDPWKEYELHPDHITCGHLALESRSCARLPLFYPDQLRRGLTVVVVPTVMLFSPQRPNYHEDISKSLGKKIEAVLCHKSQFGGSEGLIMEKIRRRAVAKAKKVKMKYSEPYHRIQYGGIQNMSRQT